MAKLFSGREEEWISFNAKGLLPRCLLLQAVLLLPYVLCSSFSRSTKSQDCCWSPQPFWTYAGACVQLKIKHFLSLTADFIVSRTSEQTVNIFKGGWGGVLMLCIWWKYLQAKNTSCFFLKKTRLLIKRHFTFERMSYCLKLLNMTFHSFLL